jgi:hypothetical protein
MNLTGKHRRREMRRAGEIQGECLESATFRDNVVLSSLLTPTPPGWCTTRLTIQRISIMSACGPQLWAFVTAGPLGLPSDRRVFEKL